MDSRPIACGAEVRRTMGLPIELAESTESELFEERMREQCASRIQIKGICTGVIEGQ